MNIETKGLCKRNLFAEICTQFQHPKPGPMLAAVQVAPQHGMVASSTLAKPQNAIKMGKIGLSSRNTNEKFHLQKTVPPDRLDVDSDSCHPILPAVGLPLAAAQAPH